MFWKSVKDWKLAVFPGGKIFVLEKQTETWQTGKEAA